MTAVSIYPVQPVRKFPKMDDVPTTTLNPKWQQEEKEINEDIRHGIMANTPKLALKKLMEQSYEYGPKLGMITIRNCGYHDECERDM